MNDIVPESPLPESLPEETEAAVEKKSPIRKVILFFGIVLVLISVIVGSFLFGKSQNQTSSIQSQSQQITTNSIAPADTSLALISYVPHFNKLTVEDLPRFADVRNVVDYKGHEIIVGNNALVEYDQTKGQFIRQNNPDVIPCIYSSAVIGNNAYIGCNTPDNETSTLYKVDLQTGKIIKQYDFFKKSGLHLVNIVLLAEGNTLWISSWDGVIKMDALSEQTKFYSPTQIFSKSCKPTHIWMEEGRIKVAANDINCEDNGKYTIAVYNSQIDSWQKEQISFEKYASLINRTLSDFSLAIPQFSAISQLVSEKYYLFSDEGVYTLQQGQFPKLLFSLPKNPQIASSYTAYVDENETQAIILGGVLGMMPQNPTIADLIFVNIINLQTKEVTNLVGNRPEFAKPAGSVLQQKLDTISLAKLKKSSDGVDIVDKDGQPFAHINLQKKSITFE